VICRHLDLRTLDEPGAMRQWSMVPSSLRPRLRSAIRIAAPRPSRKQYQVPHTYTPDLWY